MLNNPRRHFPLTLRKPAIEMLRARCCKDENRQEAQLQAVEDPSALINYFVEQMALYKRGEMLKSGQ